MPAKTHQLQIRVTAEQKATLKRLARDAGQDLSTFVLSRALPAPRRHFSELVRELAEGADRLPVLAELEELISSLSGTQYHDAFGTAVAEFGVLSRVAQNLISAMVEHGAAERGVPAPTWTAAVPPLEEPYIAKPVASFRVQLLLSSPVAFKRRNVFIDFGSGERA